MRKVAIIVMLVFVSSAVWFGSDYIAVPPQHAEVVMAEKPKKNDIYVYITGAVRKPGLYSFSEAVRVGDAIHNAGDMVLYAGPDGINMAELIHDGMHIHVPYNLEGVPTQSGGDVININQATEAELCTLPGIGPSMAKKIIDYRNEHGAFQSGDDLKKVKGIGTAKFDKIKDKVTA
ncbi:MAG: ComEA family DNA-binding protein [Megasphaera sp.]|jgi:competence protein ComEA|uniref:helix-hairpin-helix domain-containing protein n=1 Tax=Megasphaera sueciensis TaxID=349094 RepID=UPI003D06AAB9|nr:ComEA family DNA-binding protein [Megasphaera sp.]